MNDTPTPYTFKAAKPAKKKSPVLSYTLLNTWDICPHQCARRFILKDLPRELETPEMKFGTEVHSAIEQRIRSNWPLPEKMLAYEPFVIGLALAKVEPEMKLGITEQGKPVDFFDKNVWLRGKLDAPVVNGAKAVIVDWKTGKEREEPFELEIQALLLKAKYPQLENIAGRYVWLKELKVGVAHDCSDVASTWKRVNDKADVIGHSVAMERFDKTPGPLCAWCPVTDCQHNRRGK